jgi:hypothetical protein
MNPNRWDKAPQSLADFLQTGTVTGNVEGIADPPGFKLATKVNQVQRALVRLAHAADIPDSQRLAGSPPAARIHGWRRSVGDVQHTTGVESRPFEQYAVRKPTRTNCQVNPVAVRGQVGEHWREVPLRPRNESNVLAGKFAPNRGLVGVDDAEWKHSHRVRLSDGPHQRPHPTFAIEPSTIYIHRSQLRVVVAVASWIVVPHSANQPNQGLEALGFQVSVGAVDPGLNTTDL